MIWGKVQQTAIVDYQLSALKRNHFRFIAKKYQATAVNNFPAVMVFKGC